MFADNIKIIKDLISDNSLDIPEANISVLGITSNDNLSTLNCEYLIVVKDFQAVEKLLQAIVQNNTNDYQKITFNEAKARLSDDDFDTNEWFVGLAITTITI